MKSFNRKLIFLQFLLVLCFHSHLALGISNFVSRELIVQFKNPTSFLEAKQMLDGKDFNVERITFPSLSIFLVKIINSSLTEQASVDSLRTLGFIETAYLNSIYMPAFIPNDSLFADQWNLNNTNPGYETCDIDAPAAWDLATGSESLYGGDAVIAVIEEGFYREHPELQERQWTNIPELNGLSGVDDDSNGVIDDICGYRAYNDHDSLSENDQGTWTFCHYDHEENSIHGTAVAGLVTAQTNNQTLLAAPNWGCKLLLISTCEMTNERVGLSLTYIDTMKTLWLATNGRLGANIIAVNFSWGDTASGCMGSSWEYIFQLFGSKGILFVNPAPNCNIDVDTYHTSPTDCLSDFLITVTGSNYVDEPNLNLAYGNTTVDLYAPCTLIPALNVLGDDTIITGNSGASPQVASAIALAYSVPNPSFNEYYTSPRPLRDSATLELKQIVLNNVDYPNTGMIGRCVTGGRLNLVKPVRAMCNYYHDNGHIFQSNARTATGPSSNSNIAVGRGKHTVYTDGNDVFYAWDPPCEELQRIYKLTSNMYSGTQPSIASSEEQNATDVYMAWLGGPQGVSVLEHKIIGDCLPTSGFQEEWRLAKIENPVPSGEGIIASCPVVVKEAGTIPVVLAAVSGGANAGVHYWRAPGIVWHDFETWTHGVIPASEDQNVTSVSAYTWEGSNELQVAWTTDDDEVFFIRGTESGTTYTWDVNSLAEVSATVPLAQNFCNVTTCYSVDLQGGFCAWEGVDVGSGRSNIYYARGRMSNGQIDWLPPARLTGSNECLHRRAPQLHPYKDAAYDVPEGYCRVGLVYERQYEYNNQVEELYSRIECRGLRIDEGDPTDAGSWEWLPPVHRLAGKNPSITEWGSGGFGLFYTEDAFSAPFALIEDNVHLTYDLDPPLLTEETDDISSAQTWYAPLVLDRAVIIEDGGSLTINLAPQNCDNPVTIEVMAGAKLTVESGGSLTIIGEAQNPIVLKSSDSSATWSGIKVDGGRLNMQWVNMYDATTCVFTNAPSDSVVPVTIEHCIFDGSRVPADSSALMLWNSPSYTQKVRNTAIQNVPSTGGRGMYLYNCHVIFDSVTVENCAYANSYIKKITGNFNHCTFRGRTLWHGILTNSATCIPNFKCCTFENLSPFDSEYRSTIFCGSGTQPTFGGKGYFDGVSNVINDSCQYLMVMSGALATLPIIDTVGSSGNGGRNDWIQRRSSNAVFIKWLNYPMSGNYTCTHQYWSPAPNNKKFNPDGRFTYSPYETSAWGLCGGSSQGGGSMLKLGSEASSSGRDRTLDEGTNEDLFSQAVQHEDLEEYAQAQELFHNVLTSTQDARLRWLSATHFITTDVHLGVNNTWIPGLIDSLIQAENNEYDSRVYGKRLLANHYLNKTDYSQAIAICNTLLESGLTYSDSIWVVTELIGMQMAAGLIENGGGLDEVVVSNIPMRLRVTSLAQGLKLEQDILSSMKSEIESEPQQVEVPSKYELYQNYPNPFNPNTEIKFDLPENIHVELAIFNTLGQKVTTLINEECVAGAYRVIWDSKNAGGMNVASGVYIYQIKAGNFIQSRKMVLIR